MWASVFSSDDTVDLGERGPDLLGSDGWSPESEEQDPPQKGRLHVNNVGVHPPPRPWETRHLHVDIYPDSHINLLAARRLG